MESSKRYRVYLRNETVQYGHIDVEANNKDDAVDAAYELLEDDYDCVSGVEYGDDSGWELEDRNEDVVELDSNGRVYPRLTGFNPKNPVTGYLGKETML